MVGGKCPGRWCVRVDGEPRYLYLLVSSLTEDREKKNIHLYISNCIHLERGRQALGKFSKDAEDGEVVL